MNLKPWQVFVFSLVPLALVFTGVIVGSMRGVDAERETFPAPAPGATGPAQSTAAPAPPGSVVLDITARNTAWDKRSLTAPPNAQVTVRLNNQDAGVAHNISFSRSKATAATPLAPGAKGSLLTGVASENVSFTTPAGGTYYFQCDVHPDQMNGTFLVR